MLFLVAALTASACGLRVDDEQRAVALRAAGLADGGAEAQSSGTRSAADGGAIDGSTSGGGRSPSSTAGGDSTGSDPGGGPGADETGEVQSPPPADGNGGATDVGVTDSTIDIAVVADLSGPIPGLFRSAPAAVNAWAAMVNQQGGFFGRSIEVRVIDGKTSSGDARAGVLQACDSSFAEVGSMNAFDEAAGPAAEQCGLPGVLAIALTRPRVDAATSVAVFPNGDGSVPAGPARHIVERAPAAARNAGIVYVASQEGLARLRIKAWEQQGFRFVYRQGVQDVELNFSPYVLQMRSNGVRYVTFIGDSSALARLNSAFEQQRYFPEIRHFDTVAYDRKVFELSQGAIEGAELFSNVVPFNEASSVPEMSLYFEWLERTNGGAPDLFGVYAWSAARLFEEKLRAIGPGLTRDSLVDALSSTGAWDGNGMHAPHDVGGKRQSGCFLELDITDRDWIRRYPDAGFDCKTPAASV